MLGVLLIALSTLATEIGCSIGKFTIGARERRVYPIGVITNIGGGVVIFCFGLLLPANMFGHGLPGGFVFSLASLPFFLPRLLLEVAQAHTTLLALARAERSAFGFLRTITLPLLLVLDLWLGYAVSMPQLFGVLCIVVGLLFLFLNHGIRGKGSLVTLFTAVNAVLTISLYKYDITHFNSVAAEQSIVCLVLVGYFLILSLRTRQNPFALLRERRYWSQLIASTLDTTLGSFAYVFAPASIITSAKRALSVLWAVGAGDLYFHEKHVLVKLGAFAFVAVGIVLLVV